MNTKSVRYFNLNGLSNGDIDAIVESESAFTNAVESGAFDNTLDKAFAIDRIIGLAKQAQSAGSGKGGGDTPKGGGDTPKGGGDTPKGGGDTPKGGGDAPKGDGDAPEGGEYEESEDDEYTPKKNGDENNPTEFDREACDRSVPPTRPSQELTDELKTLGWYDFNTVISPAQLEFLGVYESGDQVHIDYSRAEKGAVSLPIELLSQKNHNYRVTHNHPNSASFSDADFRAFCMFPSMKMLVATTVPYEYVFHRYDDYVMIPDEVRDNIIEYVNNQIRTIINTTIKYQSEDFDKGDFAELRKAHKENKLNEYFSCTKTGAKYLSQWTHDAWEQAFEIYSDGRFKYSRITIDSTAIGEFGTADVDDLLVIARKLNRSGVRGMSDSVEQDSRHKAPYSDDDEYYSAAYDVSKSFSSDIYTLPFAKALQIYGDGLDADAEALQIIRNIQNNPDAKIKIYRAVEKGLRDTISNLKQDRSYIRQNGSTPPWADVPNGSTEEYSEYVDSQIDNLGSVDGASIQPSINVKDWVTITKRYAEDHGALAIPAGYTVISKTVNAKDLFTDGNSIHEWGYDPKNKQETLSGIGFNPPKSVQQEAERGLEWRREFGRGGTEIGVARARDLSNGRSVSLDTVKRMKAYFDRHQVDKNAEGFRLGEEGYPSAGRIAWALWGGDVGYHWAKTIVAKNGEGMGYVESNDSAINANEIPKEEVPVETAPMTTKDVVSMEPPEALPLTGELKEFLTNLLAKFNMLIWGGAGSGKSSFVLRLANELAETNTGRVLYYMTEEKVASGRLKARMDLMKAYSENINFDDQGTFDRLTALVNTGMYRYVIVDSINMINVEQTKIVELMQTFPEVSWIFIAQATKGKNAYAGIQSLAHAVDTEIATANDKGVGIAELKKHRDGPLKTHTIFGNKGMRDPSWKKSW
jgi:hypothetical protein